MKELKELKKWVIKMRKCEVSGIKNFSKEGQYLFAASCDAKAQAYSEVEFAIQLRIEHYNAKNKKKK